MKKLAAVGFLIISGIVFAVWSTESRNGELFFGAIFAIAGYWLYKSKPREKSMQTEVAEVFSFDEHDFSLFESSVKSSFGETDGAIILRFMATITPEDKEEVLARFVKSANKAYADNKVKGEAYVLSFYTTMIDLYEREELSYFQKETVDKFYPEMARIINNVEWIKKNSANSA